MAGIGQTFFINTCQIWQLLPSATSATSGISFPLNLLRVHFMSSLSNYLRSNRKRLALSQEEAAFLLGVNGMDRGIKVSRDENNAREPSLKTALAYEVIYDKPVRDLFAGLYEQEEMNVAERARILGHRPSGKVKLKRQELITRLVSKSIVKNT
jgi:DNA-binding XRE family transcriptional regulator